MPDKPEVTRLDRVLTDRRDRREARVHSRGSRRKGLPLEPEPVIVDPTDPVWIDLPDPEPKGEVDPRKAENLDGVLERRRQKREAAAQKSALRKPAGA